MTASETDIELTYWEGLRAYWRIYWPTQVAVAGLVLVIAVVGAARRVDALTSVALQTVINAVALFAFLPRISSRPYRGFALTLVDASGAAAGKKLTLTQRSRVWWFLWWRQLVAGAIAGFLAMPANLVLGIMGIHLSGAIAILAVILIIGPILLKMLIGNPFPDFRIEAQRPTCGLLRSEPSTTL